MIASTPSSCRVDESAQQAQQDYQAGLAAIEAAGEHPMDSDLNVILPALKRAAHAGHRDAQARYGNYIVGYWLTDEMFWPDDRETAISGLAMLRIAFRRGYDPGEDGFAGLAKDPVDLRSEIASMLPREWVDAAVTYADAWEACHREL